MSSNISSSSDKVNGDFIILIENKSPYLCLSILVQGHNSLDKRKYVVFKTENF